MKPQNTAINLSSYNIFRAHTLILRFSFILLLNFCQLYQKRRVNIVSMFRFLKTDIKEQKCMKRECRRLWIIQEMICVMKSSLKIVWKTKFTFLLRRTFLFFFKQKCILVLETYFFKIPKNLITFRKSIEVFSVKWQ